MEKFCSRSAKRAVAGNASDTFNRPSAVTTGPNGEIYVADGHGGESNARAVKFSKDGKLIKAWGKKGAAPGEFDVPHAIAWIPKDESSLAIAVTIVCRFSIRMEVFSKNGNNSAGRAQSSSTKTIISMWPITSPMPKIIRDSNVVAFPSI
jgi:hypothetical protein